MDRFLSGTVGSIPEGWNVVWCPECGRSVTWTDEDMKSYGETWWMDKATNMLEHVCSTPVPDDWHWYFCSVCLYTVTFSEDVMLQFGFSSWINVMHDAFAHICDHFHSHTMTFISR